MHIFERHVRIRFVSADPEGTLNRLVNAGVELRSLDWTAPLTVEALIPPHDIEKLKQVLDKEGCSYQILERTGIFWQISKLLKRPTIIMGVLLFLCLALVLPTRILSVRVTGNDLISNRHILLTAQNCGIRLGMRASDIRSEDIKNNLLGQIPELQWVGITAKGSVATIHVKERSEARESEKKERTVSSIVAVQDGLITDMTVYQGTPLFYPGESVKKGDMLISGYTDLGLKTTAQQANGEVFAHTQRILNAIAPMPTAVRGPCTSKHTCLQLQIGKKVLNFCNHSGIQDTTCVKMYSEDYWTLPGDIPLPVSVTTVECLYYETAQPTAEPVFDWLPQYTRDYLQHQMVAGEIVDERLNWNVLERSCELLGEFACHEMIGQVKYEERLEQYAEDS